MKYLLLVIATTTILYSQNKETVAVYPLHSNSINTTITEMLTNDLTTSLVTTQTFSVVGRDALMNIAVEEQSLQQNGVFNEQRIVQIGNMTGATFLVSGSVENYNGKYLYNVSLMNTETGELIKSISTDKYGTEFIAYSLADKNTRRHRDRQRPNTNSKNQGNRRKTITRIISGAIGSTALFMSIHYSTKANEYKELQGVSNFYNNVDMNNNTNDYTNEINKNETAMGISLGVSAISFAVCGVTFFF